VVGPTEGGSRAGFRCRIPEGPRVRRERRGTAEGAASGLQLGLTLALCLAPCLTPAFAPSLFADSVVSAEIDARAGARVSERGIASEEALGAGSLSLAFETERNSTVKASGSITVDRKGNLSLDRAWMRARFPWLVEGTTSRLTLGLAPLSWGKGFVFNAGDPVFGELPPGTGLSGGDYRTATDWLASLYLPLGSFSFAEAVYLPPVEGASTGAITGDRAGGRVNVVPALPFLQSLEAGWLHGEGTGERGYLAADGSLWADWYGALSFVSANPLDSASGKAVGGADWSASFGLLRIFDLPDHPLSVRVEGLAHPGLNAQNWFAQLSVGLGDLASLGLQAIAATGSNTVPGSLPAGAALAGVIGEFTPVKGFTLSAQAMRTYVPDNDEASAWVVIGGATCKF